VINKGPEEGSLVDAEWHTGYVVGKVRVYVRGGPHRRMATLMELPMACMKATFSMIMLPASAPECSVRVMTQGNTRMTTQRTHRGRIQSRS
jgi:hypothetical protein